MHLQGYYLEIILQLDALLKPKIPKLEKVQKCPNEDFY
jgi:hypothetical protein